MPGLRHAEARLLAGGESLCAPGLLRLEALQVLRSLANRIGQPAADRMVERLLDLDIVYYAEDILVQRVWKLRHNFTAYDAAYVALAELLDAPLLTRDQPLSRASGHQARIEYVALAAAG